MAHIDYVCPPEAGFLTGNPATATTKANMKFSDWDRIYKRYVYGELLAMTSRSELARELIQKYATTQELQNSFRNLPQESINYE